MATTVHLPDELLAQVDARAKTLAISRNRFIADALKRALADKSQWSPDFLRALDTLEPIDGVDELFDAIEGRRTRKGPIEL